ncbi:hypothetical protein E3A20_03530 [Planctomyces bekefii]|uniref:Dicarboxylate/amino acid:cation symporter n=1 Tax=Planctomyces bekefii TaxID=1653850 RepID=A0A5C6MDJ4_9PLAN|nr:hypothetical protein E3A20_03530 [Planctomyces bekefii]
MSVAESAERSGGGHLRILVGLAAGILLGLAAHSLQGPDGKPGEIVTTAISIAEPIGRFFLRLMQMVVLPLVFSALFLAVVDVGDLRRLGRIGLTTLFFTGRLSIRAKSDPSERCEPQNLPVFPLVLPRYTSGQAAVSARPKSRIHGGSGDENRCIVYTVRCHCRRHCDAVPAASRADRRCPGTAVPQTCNSRSGRLS